MEGGVSDGFPFDSLSKKASSVWDVDWNGGQLKGNISSRKRVGSSILGVPPMCSL